MSNATIAPISTPSTPLAPTPARPKPARRPLRQRLWRFTISSLALVGLFTLLRPFTFDLSPLISGSMSPTLQGDPNSGDWVLAERISYHFRNPRRWEIVEFDNEEGLQVMKRIAALPGESIAIKDYQLQINGQPMSPPTGAARPKYYPYGNLGGGKPFSVTTGYYFLGDDSIDSQDSRYEGPVPRNKIRARAWLIVWPLNRIGWVH